MFPNTFLRNRVQRNPGFLCLEYCLVLPRAYKFVSKNGRDFPAVLFDAIVCLTRPGVEPGTY